MAEKEAEIEVDEEDEEVTPYHNYEIASYPSDYSLDMICKKVKEKDFQIPDFQRNFVWTIKQSSLLIESFLLGLPVPQAFIYIDHQNNSLVIDGQQRMLTIAFYFEGMFGEENAQGKRQVFRLTGLDPKSPYNNKRFEELEDAAQKKLKNATLRIVNIQQLSPKEDSTSVFHIFERLNTGGTPLKPQEIRNCVFHGKIVRQLDELNKLSSWRKVLGRPRPDKHERDAEMLLRVFAMTLDHSSYEKPMKEFLNTRMKKSRDDADGALAEFSRHFSSVIDRVCKELPEKPFHIRGPINLAALDSVVSVLVRHQDKPIEGLAARFEKLKEDVGFQESIFFNTSDASSVKKRLQLAKRYLVDGK